MRPMLYLLSEPNTQLRDKHAFNCDREFIRVIGGSGVIEKVSARGLGDNVRPSLPTGIKFQEDGTDWTVRDAVMSNFKMRPVPGRYRNGDGFASELPNARITFIDCQSDDNGDAGFDLKGPDWTIDRCSAGGNAHNFRFWSSGHAKSLRSVDPILDESAKGHPLHLHICPSVEHRQQQVITIDALVATGPGVLLFVETKKDAIAPKIVIGKCECSGVSRILLVRGPPPEIVWLTGEPK